jgi:hypothetical protein
MQTVEKKYTAAILKDIATMRKAVKKGAKPLDKKGPKDWDSQIKKNLLDLRDPNSCVLGQAFTKAFNEVYPNGSLEAYDTPFDVGYRDKLKLTTEQVVEYGFDAPYYVEAIEDPHDVLRDLWIEEIKERAASRKAASI